MNNYGFKLRYNLIFKDKEGTKKQIQLLTVMDRKQLR
jgi:hypothetical protein